MQLDAPYQVMDPLSPVELEQLREDIRANGIRTPIDVDEDGAILDGHHRADLADELGVECPRRVVAGLSEEQKVDHAFAVNATRRHHDPAKRRATVRRSLLRDPHLSDRQHARRTGVSHPTVASVRAELVDGGQLESFTSRLGADGRARPARTEAGHRELDDAAERERLARLEAAIGTGLRSLDRDIVVMLLRGQSPAEVVGWLATAWHQFELEYHDRGEEFLGPIRRVMYTDRVGDILRWPGGWYGEECARADDPLRELYLARTGGAT